MINLIRGIGVVRCLRALYFTLCLTSVLTGMFFKLGDSAVGYLWTLQGYLDRFAHSTTDAVLRPILIVTDWLLIFLFFPGVIASFLFLVVFLGAFLLIGAVFGWLVQLSYVSLTGAIIVYVIIGVVFTGLLRKYWGAIFEFIAWAMVGIHGLWRLMFPVRASAYASQGGALMSRSRKDFDLTPPRESTPVNSGNPLGFSAKLTRPMGIFSAKKHKIEAEATAKAIEAEANMVAAVSRRDREGLNHFHLETEIGTRYMKRDEDVATQELKTEQAQDNLNDYKETRRQEARLPKNEKDRHFETVVKPEIKNVPQAKLYQAENRAETRVKAALKKHELKQEVDASNLPPEEKANLKKQIDEEYEAMFAADNKKASNIPIYEEEE
jgi:hypothetical protein